MVYAAGFIVQKTTGDNGDVQNSENIENHNIENSDNENAEYKDNIILQKEVSLKRTGLLLIMAGSLLVLIAFR